MPDVTQRQLEALIKGLAERSFTHQEVLDACGGNAHLLANWRAIFDVAKARGFVAIKGRVRRRKAIEIYYLTDKGRDYARLIAKGLTE